MTVSKTCSIVKNYCEKHSIYGFRKDINSVSTIKHYNVGNIGECGIVIASKNEFSSYVGIFTIDPDGNTNFWASDNNVGFEYKTVKLSAILRENTIKNILI
jgi:hypothetical protein